MNFRKIYLLALLIVAQFSFSQEGLPVYSDYLSDNYYLLHPSMAGAANCAKLRMTGRQQWFGQKDAPALQTLSLNGALGERSGGGIIVFNDKNGYHSQTGMKLTYAHHIMFSRDNVDLNQLSFGMSAGFIQSSLDESQIENTEKQEKQQIKNFDNLDTTSQQIINILEEYVKPAVAADGGNILFDSYDETEKRVKVVLQGACNGCPSSTFTLKSGIENMLKDMLNDKDIVVEALNG